MGRAYISGSRFFDQSQSVRCRAIVSEAKTYMRPESVLRRGWNADRRTAQQKNTIENTTKKICRFNQPNALSTARKIISTGIVIKSRVTITNLRLGSDARKAELALELIAAAWRDVDRRETNIEPAAPGRPRDIHQPTSVIPEQKGHNQHTTNDHSQDSEAFVSADKHIQNNSGCAADDHGTEKR